MVDRTALLVERARRGDMQAWSRLYQELFDPVFRHVRYLTGDTEVAEDLTQETFAKALVALKDFGGRSSFSTWLHGVAINVVRRHWRWERNTEAAHAKLLEKRKAVEQLEHQGECPDKAAEQRRRAAVLYDVLSTLPDSLREVFVLRDLEGFSEKEIAAQLGITRNNAAVRASRARARVRKALAERGYLSAAKKRGGKGKGGRGGRA